MSNLRRMALSAILAALLPGIAAAQRSPFFNRELELASFDSAWTRVRDSYYDASMRGLDWNALRDSLRPLVARGESRADTRAAITSLLSRLGESHFGVIPGDAMSVTAPTGASGAAGDLGIEVRFIDSSLVITSVDEGTPAHMAGLRPGWIIDEIDTLRVLDALRATGMVSTPAARRFAQVRLTLMLNGILSGPAGSTMRLAMRDDRDRKQEQRVRLRETPGQVVEFGALPPLHVRFDRARLGTPDGCIGIIRFNTFMTPILPPYQDAMHQFADCRGIVLDLRGNLGGLGAMVMGISAHVFAEPETLGTMRLREATMRYIARPVRVTRTGPPTRPFAGSIAIVVDELSASTTEILAAAWQQLGRARVFGERSAGQALPALLTQLPNGDRLMYVVADFTGPHGSRVEGAGVVPDVLLPRSRSALLAGRDESLEAAIAWVRQAPRRGPAPD
jgi:carboxyl-terminal processing protease